MEEGTEQRQSLWFVFYLGGAFIIREQSTARVESRVKEDQGTSKPFSILWIKIEVRGVRFGKIIHDSALRQETWVSEN